MDKPVKLGGNKNTQLLCAYMALSNFKMDYTDMEWYSDLHRAFTQVLDQDLRESCYDKRESLIKK